MKRLALTAILVVFALFQLISADDNTHSDKVDWEAFSKNIVKGLSLDNEGVKQASLQHIITIGDRLDVQDAVFDIMNIYRTSNNERFRQMAMVALYKIQNEWAMGFLKRNIRFETNEVIKRQIIDGTHQYEEKLLNKKESPQEVLIAGELSD